MRLPLMPRLATILTLCMTAAAALAGVASAGPPVRDAVHEEDTFVIGDYCGEPGLDVRVDLALDIRFHAVSHGRDGLVYFLQHFTQTETITNLGGGAPLTVRAKSIEKDLRITDNGDGTLTIMVLATGNAVLSGADGKAIARDPGQVRFKLLVDDGGTPSDPSDDEVIGEPELLKGSTGRSDDFCEAAVPALR